MKDGKEELGAVPHHWSDKSVELKGKAFIYQPINVLKNTKSHEVCSLEE